jgi:hypothetical protein
MLRLRLLLCDISHLLLIARVERIVGNGVKSHDRLQSASRHNAYKIQKTHVVWVLDKDVLALWLLEHKIGDSSDDTPSVAERHIHLGSKVFWLVRLDTDNDVSLGISRVGSRDETGG